MERILSQIEKAIAFTGVVFVLVFTILILNYSTLGHNLASQQATAFMQGRLDIPDTPQTRGSDAVAYKGKVYSPFPPLPAILMIPFIMLFGTGASMVVIVIPVLLFTAWAFWRIIVVAGNVSFSKYWLLIAFLFGSSFWPTLVYGQGIWFYSHLLGTAFLTIGLLASLSASPQKGFYAGMAITCAFLCRQLTIGLVPIFLVLF